MKNKKERIQKGVSLFIRTFGSWLDYALGWAFEYPTMEPNYKANTSNTLQILTFLILSIGNGDHYRPEKGRVKKRVSERRGSKFDTKKISSFFDNHYHNRSLKKQKEIKSKNKK
jgi:hypothetical protein